MSSPLLKARRLACINVHQHFSTAFPIVAYLEISCAVLTAKTCRRRRRCNFGHFPAAALPQISLTRSTAMRRMPPLTRRTDQRTGRSRCVGINCAHIITLVCVPSMYIFEKVQLERGQMDSMKTNYEYGSPRLRQPKFFL